MEVSFYHIINPSNVVSSAVRLLEKVYATNERCIFYSPIEERVKLVDKTLWTFSTNAFIPHGDKTFGYAEQQPIYFTSERENPNNATVLLAMDVTNFDDWFSSFKKALFVFDDSISDVVTSMYENLQKKQDNVNYWKQSEQGWVKLS